MSERNRVRNALSNALSDALSEPALVGLAAWVAMVGAGLLAASAVLS